MDISDTDTNLDISHSLLSEEADEKLRKHQDFIQHVTQLKQTYYDLLTAEQRRFFNSVDIKPANRHEQSMKQFLIENTREISHTYEMMLKYFDFYLSNYSKYQELNDS
jgi:hypothetical protein